MITFLKNGLKRSHQIILVTMLMFSSFASANSFEELTQKLLEKSFDTKAVAIDQLALIEDDRVKPLFEGLTQSTVYYIKKTNQLGYYESVDKKINFTTLLTGEVITELSKRKYKKVTTNNALRGQIKLHLAALNIYSKDEAIRLTAIDSMLKSPDPQLLDVLKAASKTEESRKVKSLIDLNVALLNVESENETERQVAYTFLSNSLHEAARIKLIQVSQSEGYPEEEKAFATKALSKIELYLSLL